MIFKEKLRISGVLACLLVAASPYGLTHPVAAQTVADRALSDIQIQNVGRCSTLTVNFNIRVQLLGHFPTQGGRELHIRLRPLDPGGAGTLRESLRPPSSIPALRSIDYEGDNPSGPVLSLFFTQDMLFDVQAGRDPQSLVIRIADPGVGQLCEATDATAASGPPNLQPSQGRQLAIPEGLYVVNLLSEPQAPARLTAEQLELLQDRVIYESMFERESQQWHRLRAGFFEARSEAEAARLELLEIFPDAFVVKVSAEERTQGVAGAIVARQPVPLQPEEMASSEEISEAQRLIEEAEAAMAGEENDRAIQLLTNALQLPANPHTPRALELLGVMRERKGQEAQARGEYEEYLRRYPSGEAADRVRQRLAALGGAGRAGQTLRAASGDRATSDWTWGVRGSFSQFYFRDQSTTRFIDSARPEIDPEVDNSVNVNQLLTAANFTISGGNYRREFQLRASGAYTANFRDGSSDITSLTALYLDYTDDVANMSTRVGRQTRNSAGVLGRFDGALVSWEANPKLRLNVVGGFPVLRSRQTHLLTERPFYGASVDFGARRSPFRGTVYWFDQRSQGGFVDRQSVGFETRVLLPRFNAFTIIDYDVKFGQLNLGLATLNYSFPDNSNISVTADYRQSPLLTAHNALIGQVFSDTFMPVLDLAGLRPFFTDPEIYQLADDRTYVSKTLTITYSRPIVEHLQANIDFTVTDTGGTPGTPASAGTQEILPLLAPGREYYYGAQLIGSGLFWNNDIYILSGRYANTQRTRSYTADFNARIPLASNFRLSPRIRYGRRESKIVDSSFNQIQPTIRFNYYPMRDMELELEIGANFARQNDTIGTVSNRTNETGFVINAGYRFDF